jgi:hypothetical protein
VCRNLDITDRGVGSPVYSYLKYSSIEDPKHGSFNLDMKKARILARMHEEACRDAPGWV